MDSPTSPNSPTPLYTYSARRSSRRKHTAGQDHPHDPVKQDPTYEDDPEDSSGDEEPPARKKQRRKKKKLSTEPRQPAKKISSGRDQRAPEVEDRPPPPPQDVVDTTPRQRQRTSGRDSDVANANNATNSIVVNAQQDEPTHVHDQSRNDIHQPTQALTHGAKALHTNDQGQAARDAGVEFWSSCLVM